MKRIALFLAGLLLGGITCADVTGNVSPPGSGGSLSGTIAASQVTGMGGNCTNQFVASLSSAANPTCASVTSATIAVGAVTEANASLANKPSVGLVTVTTPTLSGAQTIDSVLGVAGQTLVLVANPTPAATNGPWLMQSGAWTRPAWYPSGGTTQAFQFVSIRVRLGSTYAGSLWDITSAGAVTIDTTATTWGIKPLAANSSTLASSSAIPPSDLASGSLPTGVTVSGASLPNPTASTLGGIESAAAVSHQWINSISTLGVPALSQPGAADISGLGTAATVNTGTSGATTPLLNGANTWSGAQTFAGATGSLGGATGIFGNAINITAAAYGASTSASSAANQTAIQAAINAAISAHVPLYIPSGGGSCYNYTAPLTVNGSLDIIGDASEWGPANGNINVPSGSPLLLGSVLCPSSNGSDGIDITGTGNTVNIHNISIEFQTAFSGTGHGIYYVPALTTNNYTGLATSQWQNVTVYGQDYAHYAFYLENFIYDRFDGLQSIGGGGFYLYGSTGGGNYGNSVFVNPLVQVVTGNGSSGGSNGFNVDAGAASALNLLTFVRPQAIVNNISGTSPASFLPNSGQSIWSNTANVTRIRLIAPDFETNVSGTGMTWTQTAGSSLDGQSFFNDASAINVPAWGGNGVLTTGPTININDSTSSGTVALASLNALPNGTVTASNATTYTILAGLTLGAPNNGTNVTATRKVALNLTGGLYSTSNLTNTGGDFLGGTIQLNNSNGSNTTEVGDGSTTGQVTVGGGSNAVVINSSSSGTMNGVTIGGTTAEPGTFTALTASPAANAFSLTVTPATLTSGTTGFGRSIVGTVNDGSGVDGIIDYASITCTSCTGAQLVDYYVGGTSQFKVDTFGDVNANGSVGLGATNYVTWVTRGSFSSPAAGKIQLGQVNSATPTNYTLQGQGSRGGTDTNVAGANTTIVSGLGTGNATGSTLTLQTPHAGSTGTTAQTANSQITLGDNTVAINQIATDATHTDATICEDTTTHVLYFGSGTIGICLGTSSARFKHDIEPLDAGLAELMPLQPISYHVNADHGDPNRELYGFTAENMQTVLPKLVGLDSQGKPNTADYVGLIPVLVKAVQEQQREIADLKRQLNRKHH